MQIYLQCGVTGGTILVWKDFCVKNYNNTVFSKTVIIFVIFRLQCRYVCDSFTCFRVCIWSCELLNFIVCIIWCCFEYGIQRTTLITTSIYVSWKYKYGFYVYIFE